MDVTDRVAVVTGGGRGIGRGICLALARYGADVVVADVNLEDAEAVRDEAAAMGRRTSAQYLDVTDQGSVDSMVEDTVSRHGRIDILVNNAGIIGAPGWQDRVETTEEDWDLLYAVNVKGMAAVTDAVSPHMKERRYGKVVNIASVSGRQGNYDNPPYGISKAGVISFTQAYAVLLAPFNVNVNAICPGLLWTPMWEKISLRRSSLPQNTEGLSPRELFDRTVEERIPLGREQTPEDVGNLAVFLASEASRNITGQSVNVDGGSRMN